MRGAERLVSVLKSTPVMAEALPDLPMSETVLVRLIRITNYGLASYFEPFFRKQAASESAFHVLCLLTASEGGNASPGELAELVGASRSNMTKILDELLTAGYVSRSIEARDGRRHSIRITASGRRATADIAGKIVEPLRQAFSDLDASERAVLDKLLRKTIISFDKRAVPLQAAA